MAEKKVNRWMQRVEIKRPGALTRAAKRSGESKVQWARKHEHDSNKRTRGEALFYLRTRETKPMKRAHKRGTRRTEERHTTRRSR